MLTRRGGTIDPLESFLGLEGDPFGVADGETDIRVLLSESLRLANI